MSIGNVRIVCGIYSITNTINGKRYYGSSLNVWGRKRQHVHTLRKGTHRNRHLQAAWNLYGESKFVFELVEEVAAESLQTVEQSYLDSNDGGYNIAKDAECPARGLKRSEEFKKHMSETRKGKKLSEAHRTLLSLRGLGRVNSPETRAKLSAATTGKRHSNETKEKIAKSGRNQWSNQEYRDRMIAAQQVGKETEEAKLAYSTSAKAKWADPEHRNKMSEARKRMWANPDFKTKMLAVRKEQGKYYSGENWRDRPKKKETENALQKSA